MRSLVIYQPMTLREPTSCHSKGRWLDGAARLATAPSERNVAGMRICVIGGTGDISTGLATFLLKQGDDVTCYMNFGCTMCIGQLSSRHSLFGRGAECTWFIAKSYKGHVETAGRPGRTPSAAAPLRGGWGVWRSR